MTKNPNDTTREKKSLSIRINDPEAVRVLSQIRVAPSVLVEAMVLAFARFPEIRQRVAEVLFNIDHSRDAVARIARTLEEIGNAISEEPQTNTPSNRTDDTLLESLQKDLENRFGF
ncbi:hypothetical protein [Thermosulfurimonas sp. F29]|uniref:hypothetical protein n=1 Tax=Thermosulfurimonas sp. F29 TaxID=2867247 RepID=UPI001C8360B1|nr:hypothetical protein [Thermosulfurimonas sp. F29]MBX6423368.1 hypothetical protein [Thermosulfurimonas sp. F29]